MNIQAEAKKLANDTLSSSWTIGEFPVDPIAIAYDLGVRVFSANIGSDVSGMLRKEPYQAPEIYLDVNDPPVRRRFSCAHELGHYVRHADEGDELAFVDYRDARSRNGVDLEERFANAFAANLLMPEDDVRTQFERGHTALDLADRYDVSLDAITYRLKNLSLIR